MKSLFTLILFCFAFEVDAQFGIKQTGDITLTDFISPTQVKDQYMSSTCWSFASNSFLESELIKKGKRTPDLSEMFVARYSYLNKVKRHLFTKGETFFTPGGQFHDVMRVISEYGIVPEEVYPGKPNGQVHHDHAKLDTLMKHAIQKIAARKGAPGPADYTYINNILDSFLGKVPASFAYMGKTYTPKSFTRDVLQINPDDYVEITSYTHQKVYRKFVLESKYNWTADSFYNVPLADFNSITDAAIKNGYTVCWDGDITESGFQFQQNKAMLDAPPAEMETERQRTYEDGSSAIDHMMHIVGIGTDSKNKKWYYLKNSWGKTNSSGGFIWMQADYFQLKTIAIIVNKNAIPSAIRKRSGI